MTFRPYKGRQLKRAKVTNSVSRSSPFVPWWPLPLWALPAIAGSAAVAEGAAAGAALTAGSAAEGAVVAAGTAAVAEGAAVAGTAATAAVEGAAAASISAEAVADPFRWSSTGTQRWCRWLPAVGGISGSPTAIGV